MPEGNDMKFMKHIFGMTRSCVIFLRLIEDIHELGECDNRQVGPTKFAREK